jgi:HK97 family phage prohead protease
MATKTVNSNTLYSFPIQIAEFKAAGDEWEVAGYVSTFDNVDLGRDIVRPGAFTKTLKNGPKVRFLRDHDPRQLLGAPLKLHQDSKGLFGKFRISKTRLGEETHELLKDGALDSFSMGYHADVWTYDEKANVRELNEVTLYESSLVAMPMNEEAVVTGVKDLLPFLTNPEMTLAAKVELYGKGLQQLMDEIRGLADNRPLNEVKRQELSELLEMFSGLDDVRSSLHTILSAAPQTQTDARRVKFELDQARKRLAQRIKE